MSTDCMFLPFFLVLIAVASIARKRHVVMAMIDSCLRANRKLNRADKEAKAADQDDIASVMTLLEALQDESMASAWLGFLDSTFRVPAHTGYSRLAVKSLAFDLCVDSVHPSSVHLISDGWPGGAQEANMQRERAMCDEILAMCRGRQPRKRIVAVVGKAHVLPLRMLLGGG